MHRRRASPTEGLRRTELDRRRSPEVVEEELAGAFGPVVTRPHDWSATYTRDQFLALNASWSSFQLLPERARRELTADLAEVLDDLGGAITVPLTTRLFLARRR